MKQVSECEFHYILHAEQSYRRFKSFKWNIKIQMDHKNDIANHIKSKKLNNQRYVSQSQTIFITPRSFCEG